MLPLTLVLSYLWLTSLIFAALDYSGGRCRPYRCNLKHTVEAFQIIGLCVSSPCMLRSCTDIRNQRVLVLQCDSRGPRMGKPQQASACRPRSGEAAACAGHHHRVCQSHGGSGKRGTRALARRLKNHQGRRLISRPRSWQGQERGEDQYQYMPVVCRIIVDVRGGTGVAGGMCGMPRVFIVCSTSGFVIQLFS